MWYNNHCVDRHGNEINIYSLPKLLTKICQDMQRQGENKER